MAKLKSLKKELNGCVKTLSNIINKKFYNISFTFVLKYAKI